MQIPFTEILGIGDWNFMQLCGQVATLENGTRQLKTLIQTKGLNNCYISPSVDENGFLDILNHFHLA